MVYSILYTSILQISILHTRIGSSVMLDFFGEGIIALGVDIA